MRRAAFVAILLVLSLVAPLAHAARRSSISMPAEVASLAVAERVRLREVPFPPKQPTAAVRTLAVYVCDRLDTSIPRPSVGQAVRFASDWVSPYFDQISEGRFNVRFVPGRSVVVQATDQYACVDRAEADDEFAHDGVVALDEARGAEGVGASVIISSEPADFDAQGWRGFPDLWAHEIGHSIGWTHSYIGFRSGATIGEYDNPTDVMSGALSIGCAGHCPPAPTLAINRFDAGWLQRSDVVYHRSGTSRHRLTPLGPGTQAVFVGNGDPFDFLTIEPFVHPNAVDANIPDATVGFREGVSVHAVRDVFDIRRKRQAMGQRTTYDHVIAPGESETVHGVTIRVVGRADDTFDVEVSGRYEPPPFEFFNVVFEQ